MLSLRARQLVDIPSDSPLPDDLASLYDRFFAGKSYTTRFGEGWTFLPRGRDVDDDGFDCCLDHRTAQCYFFLDAEFRVYTTGEGSIQIASSFISLVEEDAILVSSVATGHSRRGFGQFPNYEAFFAAHGEYVCGWPEAQFNDREFARFFLGPSSVVRLGRFYSDDFLICGIEYF